MAITLTEHSVLRLMQLASVSLPVGGFAFSQGLEYAVEAAWVKNVEDTEEWLQLQLEESFTRLDLAVLIRLYRALEINCRQDFSYWNSFLLAARETGELRLTDVATGLALMRLLPAVGVSDDLMLQEVSFVTAFAKAATTWHVPLQACALGLTWSWLENQVAAATKLVPLGQTQAQVLLGRIQQVIPVAIQRAGELSDEELGSLLPGLAIASALHETQYTRLFRS